MIPVSVLLKVGILPAHHLQCPFTVAILFGQVIVIYWTSNLADLDWLGLVVKIEWSIQIQNHGHSHFFSVHLFQNLKRVLSSNFIVEPIGSPLCRHGYTGNSVEVSFYCS